MRPALRYRRALAPFVLTAGVLLAQSAQAQDANNRGYYRYPALHGETVVFAAEGDLWTIGLDGGVARRLTSHAGEEKYPVVSPDGARVAFSATYDGPTEVYVMPLAGGIPERVTWESDTSTPVGWTPKGDLLYVTSRYSTLPDPMLVRFNPETNARELLPLSQASDGATSADGKTLFFVRPGFHRNNTRRYQGGTARNIWRFAEGDPEATNLTADFPGEDHSPMTWDGRVYWANDRSGMMNLWSMTAAGVDLRQLTRHVEWDVRDPAIDASGRTGRIVYQLGADIWARDPATGESRVIDIALQSDFEQLAEIWETEPLTYLTGMALDEEGERVLLTSRGRVFAFPVKAGRRFQVDRKPGVRFRDAVFLDAERILLLSDESGEVEFETRPAHGIGEPARLTSGATTLRFGGLPSPDGKRVAFENKDNDLTVLDIESGSETVVSTNREEIADFAWSPDSQWLAFSQSAENSFFQLWMTELETGERIELTTPRTNSHSPAFSLDGKWLFFLSDRNLQSLVSGLWGPRQPEPYFDRPMEVYQIALARDMRSGFWPADELNPEPKKDESEKEGADKDSADGEDPEKKDAAPVAVRVDREGIQDRLWRVPLAAGNYRQLSTTEKALMYVARDSGPEAKSHLMGLEIKHDAKPVTVVADVSDYELSGDRKKALVQRSEQMLVVPATAKKVDDLAEAAVDLSRWSFPISLRDDYRQLFTDAWRLERDYFYDPDMHGLDWEGVREKYMALLDRVTTRSEVSDVIGEVVAELSALHVSVRGGDHRTGEDRAGVGMLGARLRRSPEEGGYVVEKIYRTDPDYPAWRSPLGDPYHAVSEGALIISINGTSLLDVRDPGELLRNLAGNQVRISVRDPGSEAPRDILVKPTERESNLRYHDWEYSRRLEVERLAEGKVGYVHLRAMGGRNLSEWYRNFYPVFDRQGLIVDVRHNRGGNIDSLILEKLLRRAWFYWKGREGVPTWNMQYAFRGHMVVLVDEYTASDGEAFAEGFRRLGLGPVIGTRTWGGEIWLSSNNRLSDLGLARAPQTGVYGPERKWLIEGWGVEPDIVVDNLPHEAFHGRDAQLETAVEVLLEKIAKDPRPVPEPPPYPDKSWQAK